MSYTHSVQLVLLVIAAALAGGAVRSCVEDNMINYEREKWCWERGGTYVRAGNKGDICITQSIEMPNSVKVD